MNEKLLLNFDEAAGAMGVDGPTLLRLVQRGACPAPRVIGGEVLFRLDLLRQWIDLDCPEFPPLDHRAMHAIRRALID